MEAVWKLDIDERQLLKRSAKLGYLIDVETLAQVAGVTRQTIYNWRSGTSSPPAKATAQLCRFLEMQPWDIWHLEVEEDPEPEGQRMGAATMMA
jgi:DNA-binding XRE family transcriptional regulator